MSFYLNERGVPVLSKQDLEGIALEQTRAFIRYDGKDDDRFSVWKFAAYYLGKKVHFEWLSNNAFILGMSVFTDHTTIPLYVPEEDKFTCADFDKDTILLDKTLGGEPIASLSKPRFTLMHECAHQLLHQGYYKRQADSGKEGAVAYSVQKDQAPVTEDKKVKTVWSDEDWMEWQANYLAGALLMPRHRIEKALKEYYILDAYQKRVNYRQSEPEAFNSLVHDLARLFRASPLSVEIRLDHIGFKRLPDLELKKPDPWGPSIIPYKEPRLTAKERKEQRIMDSYEKHLYPWTRNR